MQATPDPTLIRLAEEAARAALALQDYIAGAHAEPEDDFVTLREAEAGYGRSNIQVRRWAKDEGLGEFRNGQWYLSKERVLRHKGLSFRLGTLMK